MYHQSAYTAPSYGSQYAYASTSSQSYHAHNQQQPFYGAPAPSPPPQPSSYDVQRFREWFTHELSRLVENNRQVIHRLAYIAREHVQHYAGVMSQCIEEHIRSVHPAIKLPAFYLLDSISKNLGHPYTSLFAGTVAPIFIEAYNVVDETTRSKMEEMLVTWRTGGPHGVELFSERVQKDIEAFVWGSRVTGPTRDQVLLELDVILSQKNRAVYENPSDSDSRSHIEVLHQLKRLVLSNPMSSADLNSIYNRVRDLARTTALSAPPAAPMPPPSVPPSLPPPPQSTYSHSGTFAQPNQAQQPRVLPSPSPQQPSFHQPPSSMSPPPQTSTLASSPVPSISTGVPDVSELLKNLAAAGIVSGTIPNLSSLLSSGSSGDTPKLEPIVDEPKSDPKLAVLRDYEQQILSLTFSLSGSGLQKSQPDLISSLYDKQALRCKQCAKRFIDNEDGRTARDDHLDFHFRQNRRASQAMGRGHTRSWFVGIEDWVHDISNSNQGVDAKGKGRADIPLTGPKAAAAAAAELEASLRQKVVVVPRGSEAQTLTCPICKDPITMEFVEDDEEWVYRNAITLKGKVYHATCHADAQASAHMARLRDKTMNSSKQGTPASRSSRSRSGTPEARSITGVLESSSPLAKEVSYAEATISRKRKTPPGEEHQESKAPLDVNADDVLSTGLAAETVSSSQEVLDGTKTVAALQDEARREPAPKRARSSSSSPEDGLHVVPQDASLQSLVAEA